MMNDSIDGISIDPVTVKQVEDVESGLFDALHAQYVELLSAHTCYDILPLSSKIIVFDTELPVKKAFHALVQNSIRSAPLWDSSLRQYVGMITISDFIYILQQPEAAIAELESHKIETWRDMSRDMLPPKVIQIEPSGTLLEAVCLLLRNKIHRLPVINERTQTCAAVLTQKRLLNFIVANFSPKPGQERPSFLSRSTYELGVGTYTGIWTVAWDTPLRDVIGLLNVRRVSAVPIVDDQGCVVDIYSKSDVRNLARDRQYADLSITVRLALKYRMEDFEGVITCIREDSLETVMERIVKAQVHRLVCIDRERRVNGIISLSDILSFLLKLDRDRTVSSELPCGSFTSFNKCNSEIGVASKPASPYLSLDAAFD